MCVLHTYTEFDSSRLTLSLPTHRPMSASAMRHEPQLVHIMHDTFIPRHFAPTPAP
jgi:hypothetical protein